MFFAKDESEKAGKEVINNLYFFPETQMLDCNQYIICDHDSDELILFDAGNGIALENLFKGMERLNLKEEPIWYDLQDILGITKQIIDYLNYMVA